MVADFQVHDRVPFAQVKVAAEFMIREYLSGAIDTVEVIYSRFKNTMVQTPVVRPVLPLRSLKDFLDQLASDTGTVRVPHADDREVLFEPGMAQVLNALLPFYVDHQIHQLALSAKASEHSARMVAMKTATDNANELMADLTLEYNKARQAGITQEILEIAAAQYSAA